MISLKIYFHAIIFNLINYNEVMIHYMHHIIHVQKFLDNLFSYHAMSNRYLLIEKSMSLSVFQKHLNLIISCPFLYPYCYIIILLCVCNLSLSQINWYSNYYVVSGLCGSYDGIKGNDLISNIDEFNLNWRYYFHTL